MGHTTERTFEENVELIASSLGQIAVDLSLLRTGQEALIEIAKRNSDHICGKCHESQPDAPAEIAKGGVVPAAPTPAAPVETAAPANPVMDYEQLKFALIQRSVEVKKGTKMTTLLKLWDEHKFDELKPGATTTTGVAESAAAAAEDVPPETETPDPVVGDDIFDEPAPPPEAMTRDEVKAKLLAAFAEAGKPTPDEANAVRAAFGVYGAKDFNGVPEDKLADFANAALKKLAELHQAEGAALK